MADFSTGAELELTVSQRSLRSVRDTIESELGDLEVGVDAIVSGGGGAGSSGMTSPRRRAAWEQQRTEDLRDILNVLEDIEERGGMGGGGGDGGVTIIPTGLAGSVGGAAGGLLGGTAGLAGAAAAGPLLGGSLGFALRGMGFGARAPGIDMTGPAQRRRQRGAEEEMPQGPSNINVRISKPNWVPIQVEAPQLDRGQATRNPLAGGTRTQDIQIDNTSQINVTVQEPDTQQIVDETRREVERDFSRLRQKIEQGLGGGPGGPL